MWPSLLMSRLTRTLSTRHFQTGSKLDRFKNFNKCLEEVIELQLPSFSGNFDPRAGYSVLAPVRATLLGYVAASKDPIIGGSLLLTYTTGYVAPLLLAASFAGALQSLLSFRKFSAWINPMSGALLLGGGVYTLLDKAFPSSSMVM